MVRKVTTSATKLKVKIPFAFEAEGEGLASILCLAGLCALLLLLGEVEKLLGLANRGFRVRKFALR